MLARAAIRNPWVFRDFLPGAAVATGDWDGGRYWPSVAEVDAAAASYASMAAAVGTKPKFVAFHERNFERCGGASAMTRLRCGALRLTLRLRRLRRVAETGDRRIPVDSPATIHLT